MLKSLFVSHVILHIVKPDADKESAVVPSVSSKLKLKIVRRSDELKKQKILSFKKNTCNSSSEAEQLFNLTNSFSLSEVSSHTFGRSSKLTKIHLYPYTLCSRILT